MKGCQGITPQLRMSRLRITPLRIHLYSEYGGGAKRTYKAPDKG